MSDKTFEDLLAENNELRHGADLHLELEAATAEIAEIDLKLSNMWSRAEKAEKERDSALADHAKATQSLAEVMQERDSTLAKLAEQSEVVKGLRKQLDDGASPIEELRRVVAAMGLPDTSDLRYKLSAVQRWHSEALSTAKAKSEEKPR